MCHQNDIDDIFRATFHSVAVGMAHTSPEGRFLRVNRALCRILGYSEAELVGHTYRDITHPDDLQISADHLRQVLEGKLQSYSLEKRYLNKGGDAIWCTLTLSPLLDGEGNTPLLVAVIEDISERKCVEEELASYRADLEVLAAERSAELRQSEQRLREAQIISHLGNWDLDLVTGTLTWSDELFCILELDPRQSAPSLELFLELHAPQERERVRQAYAQARQERVECVLEHQLVFSGGRIKHLREHCHTYIDESGTAVRCAGTIQDVTSQWETQEMLRQFSRVVEQSPVSVVITDLNGSITYVNPKFSELTGYTLEEALGKNPSILKTDLTPPERFREMWDSLASGREWRGEFCNKKKDGSLYWERAYIGRVVDALGATTHYVAVKEDITEQKESEEKLRELSLSDALTGLTNRRGFLVLAQQQIKVSNRIGKSFLLMYADLDGMKWINDNLGHSEGDRALVDTAGILRGSLRSSDVVARLGGDEFVAMSLETSESSGDALRERIALGIAALNAKGERPYTLSLSVGVTRYDPSQPCTVEELVDRGDALMYEVKRQKRERALAQGANHLLR